MLHVPHKLAELAFNASHRYSSNQSSLAIAEEYNYLLSAIRKNQNEDKNKSCLAAIPSTSSWTYIDCTREFMNVTFLCQYNSNSRQIFYEELCPDSNHDYYCDSGWIFGYHTCLKLQPITKKYITMMLDYWMFLHHIFKILLRYCDCFLQFSLSYFF